MSDFGTEISQAKQNSDLRGQLLMKFRAYLKTIAALEVFDAGLRSKLGDSDLAQEVLAKADRAFDGFSGDNENDLSAWLRQILKNHLIDEFRRYHTAARDIRLEKSDRLHHDGSAVLRIQIAKPHTQTPSGNAIMGEQALLLADAIESLTKDQSEVIRLRFFAGLRIKEIAEQVGKSHSAVVGLLRRGLETLRHKLPHAINDAFEN